MKGLAFGAAVKALDVERLPADDGPRTFVRLCGSLIGRALSDRFSPSVVPAISERILVPDKGVDAEYTTPQIPGVPESAGLLGPGRTVFQFKYREASARGRAAAFNDLRTQLRRDFEKGAPACDRFVLMTNLDLSAANHQALRMQLDTVPGLQGKSIVIWGAGEIATAVNLSPHLRHLFFAGGTYCTIDVAEEELRAAYAKIGWSPFIDRSHQISAISAFVEDASTRAMRVVGPRYVGKTRLVIEALKPQGARVVWASLPDAVSIDDLRDLDSTGASTILVVDRCDGQAGRLLEDARARRHLKVILIGSGAAASRDHDVLAVGPLDHQAASRLVDSLIPRSPFLQRSWVEESAGGLPGLIVSLAASVRDARIAPSGPPEGMKQRLDQLLRDTYLTNLAADARQALTAASLLPILGIEGEAGKEADEICHALGLDPVAFRFRLPELEALGLLRRRGRFAEVLPPPLATLVTAEALRAALRGPDHLLARLRVALDEGAFRRLLERLRDLGSPDVRLSIEGIFRPDGWFPDLAALLAGAEHVRILAPAAPGSALACLQRVLGSLSADNLEQHVRDGARRSIVHALEHLALRSNTFSGAARLLLSLGAMETDAWGNNAADVFRALFHWQHPEVAAPYATRIHVLQEGAASETATERSLVARACAEAFRHQVASLHHSEGAELPERPYRPASSDVLATYAAAILEIVRRLLEDPVAPVREAGTDAVIELCAPLLRLSSTPSGLTDLGRRALALFANLARCAPDAKQRVKFVSEVEHILDAPDGEADRETARAEITERVGTLLTELTERDVRGRLWHWVGPPSTVVLGLLADRPAKVQEAIEALALDLANDPEAFEASLDWLTGQEAERRRALFFTLGARDRGSRVLRALVTRHGGPRWADAFGAYIAGWETVDESNADEYLMSTSAGDSDLAAGALQAIASLPPSASRIDLAVRVLGQHDGARVDAIGMLAGLQWEELSAMDFERLIEALDDGTSETRAALLWPFFKRLAQGAPLTAPVRDRAWSILGSTATTAVLRSAHEWDFVAAKLGSSEPEKLLALLDQLIALGRKVWGSTPIDSRFHQVRTELTAHHRESLIELLLRAEMAGDTPAWVGWQLERLIDPIRDASLLLDFAKRHGVAGARTIALGLDADSPAFWQGARALLASFGSDAVVRDRLATLALSGTYSGSALPMIASRIEEARRLASDPDHAVSSWALEIVDDLEQWKHRADRDDQEQWIWDYQVRKTQLDSMLRSADSPQRLWALGRLLADGSPERVRDLLDREILTPQDIIDVLPKLGLDDTTRRKWLAYARHRLAS